MMTPPLLPLLNWWWQSALLLGAGWLLYQLGLRQEPSFRYNRRFLLLAPLLALVLPPLLTLATPPLQAWLMRHESATALLPPAFLLPDLTTGAATDSGSSVDFSLALLGLYVAGVLLGLGRLGWQLLRLGQATRGLPRELRAGYVLVRTGGRLPVSSFGRYVFWDDNAPLSAAEARLVLAHEVAHVRQRHSLDRLLLEVLKSLLWLNPFVYLFPRALELTHEYLADEAVLGPAPAPAAATAYGALLARLTLQRLRFALPLTHSFTYSQTLHRIAMLTTSHSVRRWKQWLPLPAAAALLLALAATNVSAQTTTLPPPPPPPTVYDKVDQMPEYPGGQAKLMQDLGAAIKYPAAAKTAQLEGKVFVQFIVGADGTMQAVSLKKGVQAPAGQAAAAKALDEAAVRAVQSLNAHWTPGRNKGKAVAVSYIVPLTFAL